MGQLIGLAVGSVVGAAICSLVLAMFIKMATRWVTRIDMRYGDAYKTAFTAVLANIVVGFVLTIGAGMVAGGAGVGLVQLALIPIGFLIMTSLVNMRLELGFAPAILVTLIAYATSVVIAILVILGVLGLGAAMAL